MEELKMNFRVYKSLAFRRFVPLAAA